MLWSLWIGVINVLRCDKVKVLQVYYDAIRFLGFCKCANVYWMYSDVSSVPKYNEDPRIL